MTEQFYVAVNGQETGPFTFDELKAKGIKRDTLVWTEGLEHWTKAENVLILKEMLRGTPPPLFHDDKDTQKPLTQSISTISPPPISQSNGKYFGYELARRRERLFAHLIQGILISVPVLLIVGYDFSRNNRFEDRFGLAFALAIFGGIINMFFYPLWSGNIGHKLMGLKVISKDYGTDYNKAVNGGLREGLKHILSVFVIPSIWLLWDNDRQNVYDKISKTLVVKKK